MLQERQERANELTEESHTVMNLSKKKKKKKRCQSQLHPLLLGLWLNHKKRLFGKSMGDSQPRR